MSVFNNDLILNMSDTISNGIEKMSKSNINKADYDRTLIGTVVEKTTKPNIIGGKEITDGTWLWLIQCADSSYYIENYKANITAVGQRVRLYIPNHDFTEKYAEVIDNNNEDFFKSMKTLEICRVSDNEVYVIYQDPSDKNIQYKQTWTAEGTGNTRYNPKEKVEISKDGGKTWESI